MNMQDCITNCTECHEVCVETVMHCLRTGGRHAELAHVRLLMDCAEICETSANFMLRGSDLHTRICGVCADICERCARDCESLADDDRMRQCAEICHRCAQSCREMSAMAA